MLTTTKTLSIITGLLVLGATASFACAPLPDTKPTPPPEAEVPIEPGAEDWGQADVDTVLTPEVRDRILNAVATDLNRPAETLRIHAAETATWDGCMGIYVPDQLCTMIAIAGLRLVITDGVESWVYHTQQNGDQVTQNPTASGSKNGLIPDFIPTSNSAPNPVPENVVFRSVESGSLAGSQREIVLFTDGRLVHQDSGTVIAEKQLSPQQLEEFQTLLSQERFPNLHRLRYITDAAFADYPTVRLSAGAIETEYIDLALGDAPSALQTIVQAWSDLAR